MPEEYLKCVETYKQRGFSEKVAKARCAAAYYKKHGKTVKEAAKEMGEATIPDYDENLVEAILGNMTYTFALSTKGNVAKAVSVSASFIDEGDNIFEIIATREGAVAFSSDGYALVWPSETLAAMGETWTGGRVTANHDRSKVYGKIIASWYSPPYLHQLVQVNDEMAGWIRRNMGHISVSIEADMVVHEDGKILSARGTGVTFVFPPHEAGCKREDGCMVLASDVDGAKLTYEERQKLPDEAFCGPDRSFPAHDAAHVRNGLARLPQSNFSEEVKRKIYNCLKERAKKYGIEVSEFDAASSSSEVKEMNASKVGGEPTPTEEVGAKGDAMSAEQNITAEASGKADVAKVAAELEAAKKKIAELEEYKKAVMEKEKERLISVIASYIDPAPYKDAHLCTLTAVASALESYRKKFEEAPIKNSGAEVRASDVTKPPLPPEFDGDEKAYKQFLEAIEKAKKYGREIKVM